MKICSKCGVEKPADEFYKRSNGTPNSRCKKCHNNACAKRRQTSGKRDYNEMMRLRADHVVRAITGMDDCFDCDTDENLEDIIGA